jgi:hypothetical protein
MREDKDRKWINRKWKSNDINIGKLKGRNMEER